MDIFRALGISASGLAAQRARMDVISENIANSETSAAANGRPYQRKAVVLQAVDGAAFPELLQAGAAAGATGAPAGGVRVAGVTAMADAPRRVYQPGHPQAGPDGFVTMPNVNPLTEMVDMLSTTRAYEANITAFQATKSMASKLLEILR
jgi:flagellar basal-body rod protein FlgC